MCRWNSSHPCHFIGSEERGTYHLRQSAIVQPDQVVTCSLHSCSFQWLYMPPVLIIFVTEGERASKDYTYMYKWIWANLNTMPKPLLPLKNLFMSEKSTKSLLRDCFIKEINQLILRNIHRTNQSLVLIECLNNPYCIIIRACLLSDCFIKEMNQLILTFNMWNHIFPFTTISCIKW